MIAAKLSAMYKRIRTQPKLLLPPTVLCMLVLLSPESDAEVRLYHLRVTLRNGQRYETISAHDPINYCHMNGGSVICLPDYSLIYSPNMKVKILRTWIDTSGNLSNNFAETLRVNRMLENGNHKPLRPRKSLTLMDMCRPE